MNKEYTGHPDDRPDPKGFVMPFGVEKQHKPKSDAQKLSESIDKFCASVDKLTKALLKVNKK